jgi:hypothetical protein
MKQRHIARRTNVKRDLKYAFVNLVFVISNGARDLSDTVVVQLRKISHFVRNDMGDVWQVPNDIGGKVRCLTAMPPFHPL